MSIFQAIILGIIQGVTEFLPISSTGHLIILPYLFGWKTQSLSFDVALHLGTMLAVLVFFFSDWKKMIASLLDDFRQNLFRVRKYSLESRLFLLILTGCLPAFLAGFALDDLIEEKLYLPLIVVLALIIFALVMWWVDKKAKDGKNINSLNIKDSLVIGIFQSIALIPGVSRSGSTIVGGMLRGFCREEAARFSFLLSTPVIIGAGVYELLKLFKSHLEVVDNINTGVGFFTSAIFGFLTIKYFLRFLQKHDLTLFIYYRIVLGVIILGLIFWKRIV